MRLKIDHRTIYSYDEPVPGGLQQLRLTPTASEHQRVLDWTTTVVGGKKQVAFVDQHGNHTDLVSIDPGVTTIEVQSSGQVETSEAHGVVGYTSGFAPLWLFRRSTSLTTAGDRLVELAESVRSMSPVEPLEQLHTLMDLIVAVVEYEPGTSVVSDTAEDVLAAGRGVCQDHAHVLITAARHLGYAARYISGYLQTTASEMQGATHAWAEVWIPDLGWVGFDPSNAISPDERYVRMASGLDYTEAAPISGMRYGAGDETLEVSLSIQQ